MPFATESPSDSIRSCRILIDTHSRRMQPHRSNATQLPVRPENRQQATHASDSTNVAHHHHPLYETHPTPPTPPSQLAFDQYRLHPPPTLLLYCPMFSLDLGAWFITHVLNGLWISTSPAVHGELTAYANACALMELEPQPVAPSFPSPIALFDAILAYNSSRCFLGLFPGGDVGTLDSIKFASMWHNLRPWRRENTYRSTFVEWCCAWLSVDTTDFGGTRLTTCTDNSQEKFLVSSFLLQNTRKKADIAFEPPSHWKDLSQDEIAFLRSKKPLLYRELGLSDDDWVELVLSRIGGALGFHTYLWLSEGSLPFSVWRDRVDTSFAEGEAPSASLRLIDPEGLPVRGCLLADTVLCS